MDSAVGVFQRPLRRPQKTQPITYKLVLPTHAAAANDKDTAHQEYKATPRVSPHGPTFVWLLRSTVYPVKSIAAHAQQQDWLRPLHHLVEAAPRKS